MKTVDGKRIECPMAVEVRTTAKGTPYEGEALDVAYKSDHGPAAFGDAVLVRFDNGAMHWMSVDQVWSRDA